MEASASLEEQGPRIENRDLPRESREEERKDSPLAPVLIYTFDQKSPQIALPGMRAQSDGMGSCVLLCMPCLLEEKVTYCMI